MCIVICVVMIVVCGGGGGGVVLFFQAEDGIRDLVRSRGLGDVYKRQRLDLLEVDVVGQEVRVGRHDRLGDDCARILEVTHVPEVGLSLIHI